MSHIFQAISEWFSTLISEQAAFWVIWGFAAQLMFTGRFIVQWIASERQGKSVIPLSFWFLSLGGSFGLLTYAIVRKDPVFIAGQSLGSIIYMRNLHLIFREKQQKQKKQRGFEAIPIEDDKTD